MRLRRAVVPREDVGDLVRDNAAQWRPLLSHPDVARRPQAARWSCLEYACHVRDVFRLYDERLLLMLRHDGPQYPNWDQDQTAVEADYGSQDPVRVAGEIEDAAATLAARFDAVRDDEWHRTGTRSDGAHFTVETFARYFVHDPVHHLHDVRVGYEALA